jgi:molecular chaperone DnaK
LYSLLPDHLRKNNNKLGLKFSLIRFSNESVLAAEEIVRMKKEAEANADSDKLLRERTEKLNEADGMIFQTETQLKELGSKLSDDNKVAVADALFELRMAKSLDIPAIQTAFDNQRCLEKKN